MYCSECSQYEPNSTELEDLGEDRGALVYDCHVLPNYSQEKFLRLKVCTYNPLRQRRFWRWKCPLIPNCWYSILTCHLSRLLSYRMKWTYETSPVWLWLETPCAGSCKVCAPTCWHFQLDKKFCPLDWVGNCCIRLAIANHADCRLSLPDTRVKGQKYWDQSEDAL